MAISVNPQISVIVPVYNVGAYLPACLDSLVRQTCDSLEIICVNDGSTDDCGAILDDYARRFPQIRVITRQNAGVSAARNAGMAAATGDYIMFVDGDDWVDQAICSSLLDAASANAADCVMCSYVKEYGGHTVVNSIFDGDRIWDAAEVAEKIHRRLFGLIGSETRHPEHIDLIVSSWMQLFRRELCAGIAFVDLKKIGSAEDCLFQMEVYAKCRKFVYIDQPLYHYRKDNGASLTSRYNPHLFERWQNLYGCMEKLIEDNGYSEKYRSALSNRILFGLIGLGLNEISAPSNMFQKANRLKYIVSQDRYRAAFAGLDTTYMPPHWKVFFFCAKSGMALPLVVLLEMLDFARKRI